MKKAPDHGLGCLPRSAHRDPLGPGTEVWALDSAPTHRPYDESERPRYSTMFSFTYGPRRWTSRVTSFLVALVALLAVADRCVADPVKIRLGIGGAAADTLFLLLARPDLAPNQGKAYTVEYTRFEGTDKRFQAFEAGALDITVMNANGAIFAAGEEIAFKFIASLSLESAKGAFTKYMVRADSPIRSVSDLKGKTIGINSLSSQSELAVRLVLDKAGLKVSDVRIIALPFPAQAEAVRSGLVAVGSFPQPFAAIAEHSGGVGCCSVPRMPFRRTRSSSPSSPRTSSCGRIAARPRPSSPISSP